MCTVLSPPLQQLSHGYLPTGLCRGSPGRELGSQQLVSGGWLCPAQCHRSAFLYCLMRAVQQPFPRSDVMCGQLRTVLRAPYCAANSVLHIRALVSTARSSQWLVGADSPPTSAYTSVLPDSIVVLPMFPLLAGRGLAGVVRLHNWALVSATETQFENSHLLFCDLHAPALAGVEATLGGQEVWRCGTMCLEDSSPFDPIFFFSFFFLVCFFPPRRVGKWGDWCTVG